MAGRFAVSPFKNVQANVGKKEAWFSELPLNSTSPSESSDAIKATDQYAVVRGSGAGSLAFLPLDRPGKYGSRAPTFSAAGRAITDFDASFLEPLVAAASEDGRISVFNLPEDLGSGDVTSLSLEQKVSLSAPAQRGIEVVQFHPTTSSLLLSVQSSTVEAWDVQGGQRAAYTLQGPSKGIWSASWSHDGRLVQVAGKDNTISLWDVRGSVEKPVSSAPGHQGFNKASRITSVGDFVFTTGFSKMRDRECCLWDPRNFDEPLKTTRIDTNTGVLIPLVDHARKIVYLAGRVGVEGLRLLTFVMEALGYADPPSPPPPQSDMTLRWAEITSTSNITVSSAALPVASSGAAILPATSSTLDVMRAEIAKMVILSQDSVVPVTMQVLRRTYLDFHSDLYPAMPVHQQPAQSSTDWLQGKDDTLETVVPQPNKQWGTASAPKDSKAPPVQPTPVPQKPAQAEIGQADVGQASVVDKPTLPSEESDTKSIGNGRGGAEIAKAESPETTTSSPEPKTSLETPNPVPSSSQSSTASTAFRKSSKALKKPQQATAPTAQDTTPVDQTSVSVAAKGVSQHPHWSRSFLAGKTALKPDYDDLHGVAMTMNAAVQLLKANPLYFFYPLGGPGGRLAYHPIAAKGRLPTHPPTLATGSDIVDFALDPFDAKRVYIACNDGKIRVLRVPDAAEGDIGEAEAILEDSMDKLIELQPSPTIANLLLSVSEDGGDGVARLWNVGKGVTVAKAIVPGRGVFSSAWDDLGSKVAFTCKDRKVRVCDIRKLSTGGSEFVTGTSHDSVRPSKVVWAGRGHVITCGFNRSAFREIAVHAVRGDALETLARTSLDISPSPLFIEHDRDTGILLAYSKGERTCHAYEVNLQPASKTDKVLTKLPSFEHGALQISFSFRPKQTVDVRKVEILGCLRMTSSSVQNVSFVIPRARMEFFQDDIFVPTLERLQPAELSVDDWLSGKDVQERWVDLQPKDMQPLSQAPTIAPKAKTHSFAQQQTREVSEEQYLDTLFKNKQAEVDSDEDDARIRRRDTVDDDDDW